MDGLPAQAYHSFMNAFGLLAAGCIAALTVVYPASADQVNQCRESNGRRVMTDRPCGDPSAERNRDRRAPQIVVEQIEAEDIFSARSKIREEGLPVSPESRIGSGMPPNQGTRIDVY